MITKNEAIDILVDIAKCQTSVREEGGNNKGVDIVKYQERTWLKPGSWAWCAAFMCYVLDIWIHNKDVLEFMKIQQPENWRCKDASAFGWIKWAKQRKIYVTDERELAKKGDIVVFDFSHIGIVIEDQKSLTSSIITIEGNTEPNTVQRDGNSDGVYQMKRSPKLVKAYIRLIE